MELKLIGPVSLRPGGILLRHSVVPFELLLFRLRLHIELCHVYPVALKLFRKNDSAAAIHCATKIFLGSVVDGFDHFASKIVKKRFGRTSRTPLSTIANLLCIKYGCVSDTWSTVAGTLTFTRACVLASSNDVLTTLHLTDSSGW